MALVRDADGARVRDRKRYKGEDPRAILPRRRPPDDRAPVVTDEMEPFEADGVRNSEDVRHELRQAIGIDADRPREWAVAALIERNDAESRGLGGLDQGIPHDRGLGKPVQKQQRRAGATKSRDARTEGQIPGADLHETPRGAGRKRLQHLDATRMAVFGVEGEPRADEQRPHTDHDQRSHDEQQPSNSTHRCLLR